MSFVEHGLRWYQKQIARQPKPKLFRQISGTRPILSELGLRSNAVSRMAGVRRQAVDLLLIGEPC